MKKIINLKDGNKELAVEITIGNSRFNCRQLSYDSKTLSIFDYAYICEKVYSNELQHIETNNVAFSLDTRYSNPILYYTDSYDIILHLTRAWKVNSFPEYNELNISKEDMKGLIKFSHENDFKPYGYTEILEK